MSYPRIRPTLRLSVAALIAVAVALPPSAMASAMASGDRVVRRGRCSGPSTWKLDVRRESGSRLRVQLEIQGGRAGQSWHVFISDDGARIFAGSRTSGAGGLVEVRVGTTDRPGADAIKAAANNQVTRETCAGRATL